MHQFGLTSQQLAQIAINDRRNAAKNPTAVYREEITLDDYLAARFISWPLRLLDCDVPVDGSIAVVLSRLDSVAGLRRSPIVIESVGTALSGRYSWDQIDDLTSSAAAGAAQMLWSRTEITPHDLDMAQLYDGISFETIMWLEALGICGRGEAGPFIEGGSAIGIGGLLPLNTDGGQLSAGRLHGYGLLYEACAQLWNRSGPRQVAERSGVGVVGVGGGPLAGCLLLRRD
jgi:acetyl-CoA acetyltransferase